MATLKNLLVTKSNTSTSDIESNTHLVQPKIESFPSAIRASRLFLEQTPPSRSIVDSQISARE
ncbi:hypothetical protein SI65_03657 [Aspergillus cristatus]|uniref:Uncharacterized protein n=1 Tax=Aspergillus cristatus TaxID=573508 RepID=A0A1E3BI30_ASPCR|nr:hypothetical protein SI65_03657 [Aspergillus cristatus]